MENNTTDIIEPIKKKRGRKKKVDTVENNTTVEIDNNEQPNTNIPKKRGRKPKGGKLITKEPEKQDQTEQMPNVILHLKCSLSDLNAYNENAMNVITNPLEYNPTVPPTITTFNGNDDDKYTPYEDIDNGSNALDNTAYDDSQLTNINTLCKKCNVELNIIDNNDPQMIEDEAIDNVNLKDVNMKLKQLKIQLYKSNNPDKKSACFWCTYEYDNPTCYIPKCESNDELSGYGSFCRPECAVAFLMKENIDDTTKFERYHLINQFYGRTYGYSKNIKPAPDPHYLLDKFYGNLSIQEYRKLLKTEHMLLIVEKPMTRILPELHDDMEDFGSTLYDSNPGKYNNNAGVYKVKRQSEKQKGPSKTEIMKENFGF